ncbi:TetR/AcrR family transcriptional regulator [Symbioplanes lichenis]|uniref:TetR/AcrR family transcriptional regulator n=1 Tax=Symbioplanes lichenis TaxID=1629072 RepID=UPI0027398A0F|nr:TetR/AcrR family transcriptional regulator [Actinoplanes lichenis]
MKERDTARTRRIVLDAAARVVGRQGSGASVDAIARAAGVSKGGLLHHFKSRDQLLLALAEDLVEQWTAAVRAKVDPRDHGRGRLVRAYVNALFDETLGETGVPEHVTLYATLAGVPGVAELLRRDKERWREAFEADGLDPDRVLLVVRAADGAAVASLYEGGADPGEIEHTRRLLLALTEADGPPT